MSSTTGGKTLLPVRWMVAVLAFFGFVFNYMLRVNINLTIVSMVNYTQDENDTDNINECNRPAVNNSDTDGKGDDGEFVWDSVVQSQIIGSFYYGYIVTQVPGGRMAEVIGAKKVLALSMGGTAILTLLLPLSTMAASKDGFPWMVIVVRALMGVCEGGTFPAVSAMMSKWAPQNERSRMSTFIYAGSQAGTIIAFPLAGFISDTLGWQWVFYIQGSACLVWVLLWWILVSDTPAESKYITKEEVEYIERGRDNLAANKKAPPVPWKDLFTSKPFWAIFVANFGNNWGFHLLLTELPIYMKTILRRDINSNALLSALPYACMWAFSLLVSYLADKAISKKILPTGIVRRIATAIAHAGPAFCLIGICFTGCNDTATIALLTLAITMQGALYTGFFVNPLDIASNFSGTILGITNAFGTIPGWLAPLIAGSLTRESQTIKNWQKVWYVTIAVLLAETTFYLIFASGEEQSWNKKHIITTSSPNEGHLEEKQPEKEQKES